MNMATDRLHGRKTLKVANFLDEFEKDDVRKKVDIVELFHHFGITLTKKGKSHMAKCPWHDDANPSLSVDRDKGLYNCFGCGESGDIFTLTEKMKGVDFKGSLAFLKSWRGNSSPSPASGDMQGNSGKRKSSEDPATVKKDTSDGMAHDAEKGSPVTETISLTAIAAYYHKKLYEKPEAVEYLKKRGLVNPQNYERFQIGYADGSLLDKIGESQRKELVNIGILNERGSEHFRGCITFPIFDDTSTSLSAGLGQVVGIYGRRIEEPPKFLEGETPSGGARSAGAVGGRRPGAHLYLKGKHRGIFNRKASKVYDEIILTESIIDALSLIEAGIQNVQSIYGTNGFTDEHLQILKDDRVKTIILAFDNDDAGKAASEKLKDKLLVEGFAVKIISPERLPSDCRHLDTAAEGGHSMTGNRIEAKDWNEFLCSGGNLEAVKEAIEKASRIIPETDSISASLQVVQDQLSYTFTIGEVAYRVSGVKDLFIGNLRVNIKASLLSVSPEERTGESGKYFDNLDLYSARSRANYSLNLSKVFSLEPKRVEKDIIRILEYLEAQRDRKLRSGERVEEKQLSPEEVRLGLSLLEDPNLFETIVSDMETLGYVGEDLNKKLLYLAASSRVLDDPVSVLILSQSASGKSMLVDTVKKLIPPDDVIAVTSLSDQALNYAPSLTYKFLILGEAVHNDVIEHQIREMLSGKELSRLVTMKDEKTGTMSSKEVKTPAIVSAVMSGTNHSINPENASRCFIVNADESKEQTRRIHEIQREKYSLETYYRKSIEIPEIIRKHHAAQMLLRKILVVNPFAKYLNFPDNLMRTRRDHERFNDLIAGVCFLRQRQKETLYDGDVPFIECDMIDYEIAYDIMINGVLSTTMTEIPRGAIDFYEAVRHLVRKIAKKKKLEPHEVSVTQRDIREATGLGQSWIKQHLRILVDYEYILLVKGGGERTKGYYRLKADEPVQRLDLSMIPTPEEMKNLSKGI